VSCRVPVRRVVTAPDMPTSPAHAQVHPRRADLQTLLAPERARCHLADPGIVRAFASHQDPPIRVGAMPLVPAAARNVCTATTTCAPSPTAAATRLTEPERTSPIAKMPGTLVSSGLLT